MGNVNLLNAFTLVKEVIVIKKNLIRGMFAMIALLFVGCVGYAGSYRYRPYSYYGYYGYPFGFYGWYYGHGGYPYGFGVAMATDILVGRILAGVTGVGATPVGVIMVVAISNEMRRSVFGLGWNN